jgi:hypothetical protein
MAAMAGTPAMVGTSAMPGMAGMATKLAISLMPGTANHGSLVVAVQQTGCQSACSVLAQKHAYIREF